MNAALLNSGHSWHLAGAPLYAGVQGKLHGITGYAGPKRLESLALCHRGTYNLLRSIYGTWEYRTLWYDDASSIAKMFTFYKMRDQL